MYILYSLVGIKKILIVYTALLFRLSRISSILYLWHGAKLNTLERGYFFAWLITAIKMNKIQVTVYYCSIHGFKTSINQFVRRIVNHFATPNQCWSLVFLKICISKIFFKVDLIIFHKFHAFNCIAFIYETLGISSFVYVKCDDFLVSVILID